MSGIEGRPGLNQYCTSRVGLVSIRDIEGVIRSRSFDASSYDMYKHVVKYTPFAHTNEQESIYLELGPKRKNISDQTKLTKRYEARLKRNT